MAGEITRKASLIFDADTSRAQAQIQSLASSLNTVFDKSSQRSGISQIDQELQQATLNAATLQAALNQAVNVNTGKLDLTKFNASLKSANLSLSTLQSSLGAAGTAGNTAFVQLARSIATAEAPLKRTNGLIQSLAVSLGNTIKWNISSSIMNGFISSVQTAFNYAEKLNDSLTRIQIVTGESNNEMAKFAAQANKSAQALSTTTRRYTDAALIFYQQGLKDADVKARTDAVIKMANVTGDASKEVSNYMTAIWNNFDNGTSSLESFEDKIVSLGATTASSSAEIAAGLEKFAAVGNTIGLSFDYAAAALATVVAETRQSADTVGTSFRTLFSRLQGLKLGETLEDGTTLNKYSQALAAVGVQIQDTAGNLREMDDILDDLAGRWDTLSKAQQVALAQTVGGARQYTTLVALMDNWEQFQTNLLTEANSSGALNQQAEIYAQSWEAAKNRVTASMEELYSSLIDDKFFINLNNGLANVLTGVNSFIQNLGGVKGALMNIGTIALNVFDKQMTQSLDNLIHNVKLTFGTTAKEMKALQTEATSLLTTTVGSTGTAGGSAMATAYAQEAAAQMKLIEQSEQLSAGEKLVADILTERIQKRVDEQTAIADATDKAEAALDREQASLNQLITAASGDSGVQQAFANMGISAEDFANQLRSAYSDLESFENISADMGNIFINLNSGKDLFFDGITDLQNYVNSIDITGFSEQGQAAFQQLADAINNPTSSLDELQAAYDNFSQTTDGSIKTVQDNMDKLNDEIKRVWEEMEKNPGDASLKVTYNHLMDLYEGYHNVREKAETYGMTLSELQEYQRRTGQAVWDLNRYLEEHQVRFYSAAEQITLYARSITTLATLVRNISNLTKVWSDDTKSLTEKLLTTVTTLGFMVPQLVRVSTQFIKMSRDMAVAKAIKETDMAADAAQKHFATFGGTIKALGSTIATAMPYLLLLAAAIGVVIAAVKTWNELSDNTKTPVDNIISTNQRLKTASQELNTALSNVKTEAQNIKDKFSQYNEIRSQLDNCKQGTTEWYDQLTKVRDMEAEILTTTPELLDFRQNHDKYGFPNESDYKLENGSVDIDALVTDYTAMKQNEAMAISAQQVETQQLINTSANLAELLPSLNTLITNSEAYQQQFPAQDPMARFFGTTGGNILGVTDIAGTTKRVLGTGDIYEKDEILSFLNMLDQVTGDSTFSDAYLAQDVMDRELDNTSKARVRPISQAQMAQGILGAASTYGLSEGTYDTLDEALEAWKNDVGPILPAILESMFGEGTTVDSILTSLDNIGLDNGSTLKTQLEAEYAAAFQEGIAGSSGAATVNLAGHLSDSVKAQLTPQQIEGLNGNLGDLVVQQILSAIDVKITPDMLEEYRAGLNDSNVAKIEPLGNGKYAGYDANNNIIDEYASIDAHTIKASSEAYIQAFSSYLEAHGAEVIQSVYGSLGPAADFVTTGNFGNYTLSDAYAAQLAMAFDETVAAAVDSIDPDFLAKRVVPQFTAAEELYQKYWTPGTTGYLQATTGLTVSQVEQFDALPIGQQLKNQIAFDLLTSLNADQMSQLLNFDFNGGETAIETAQAFSDMLNGFANANGLAFDTTLDSWNALVSTIDASRPVLTANAEAWRTVNDETLTTLSQLAQGKSITSKTKTALEDAGFNVSGLEEYQGKYRVSKTAKDPLGIKAALTEVSELQAAGVTSITEQNPAGTNFINRDNKQRDKIAQALGYENYDAYSSAMLDAAFNNPELVDAMSEKLAALKPEDIEGYIDIENYDFNALYEIAAQFGTMWRDTLEKIDKGLADQYAPLMAQRQAEIEGLTLSSVELKSITDLKSMDMVLNGRRTVTKASTLAGLYGKQDWTATDFMTAQQYEGLNITEDMDYSQRQAAIAAYMETLSAAGPYAAELQSYLEAIADTDFSEATSSLTQLVSQLQTTQDLLDNFNLNDLASNSSEAWEALTKKIGLTRTEFSKLSKEQQRSKLGEAQRSNLADILTQQQALAQAYEKHYQFNGQTTDQATLDSYVNNGTMSAYTQYLQVLQQIATTRQNMATSQNNEKNDIIAIRVAELDARIAALQAANEAEQAIVDKYSTASSDLVNAITDGALSAVQRLQIAGVKGGAEILAAWDAAGTSGERAMAAAQMTAKYTEAALQQQANVQAGINGAQDWFGGRSAGDKLLSTSAWSSTDEMKALWENDKTLSDQAINELITADQKVRNSLGENATTADYAKAMKAELETMSSDAQAAWDQIAASGKDTLSGIFVNLGEEARTAAETATEAWLSAFEAIANARATLMQGGNLLETLAGNPETLLQLARGTATDGDIAGQMQRIVQGTTSGTLKASDLNSNLSWQDYKNNQLAQYNLNATANGWAAQFAQGNATRTGDKYRLANQLGLDVNNSSDLAQLNEALIDSYSKILQANGMEAQAAETLARKAVETGEGYDEVKKASGNLSSAIDYSTGLYILQQKSAEDATAIQAAGDVTQMSYGGRTQEQWTKLQDAISKGQTAAKTSTDQSSWEQQMLASGYGDALQLLNEAGIGFGNVNTAAESCAAALAALASAAEAAAKKEAQERGYTQNAQGKWQKDYSGGVTQSQLKQEYGEEGWQSVANTLTPVTDKEGNIIKYTGVYVDEGLTAALQTIITQSQQAQASLEQIQLQKLSDAAAALGTDVGGLDSYIQSIALAEGTLQSMTDTWGDWEDMALSTQTMLADAAIEYNKSIAAIEKISEADALFKAIDKEAGTDATALKEKAAAYRELADAVNNYFLDGLADPQFVQDNLQLIKDWANGSIEAMEQLEGKLLAVFNEQYELNISSESLAELNNWANGLQFGESLTQEQLDWINNFQQINNLTDEQLAKMVDLCGVTLEFNHESVEIPQNTKAANEQLAKMVKNAQAIDKSTRAGAEQYAQQVEAIRNANSALKKVEQSIKAAGQAGEKSYKDLAKQGANLAALAAAPKESFVGYKGILDANAAKTAAWNDALQNVSESGTSVTDALNQANKSLEAMGEKPINVPVEVDTSKADADLAQVTDLEGLIHYLEEHEEVDPAVLEQEGVINYSYTGDAPSYHTEEETAANNTTFSGGGEVSALGLSVPYHFTYTADGDTTAAVPVLDGASGGTGNRGGGGGGGRRGGRGGGGGGGGGRRQDYTGDKKRKEHRYVTNTNQLEDLQHILEKINKAEERTYGRNRLKQMQAKAKALEDVAKKQKDLYNEAIKYAAQDKKDLQSNDLAKKMGLNFQFDENGTILNRDEIEQKMVDYYNSFTNGRNEKGEYILKDNSEAGEAKFKMMQEDYAELEKLLDKYDESQDKIKEYWEAYMDSINEAYDVIVEMANYKVEVQVEVSDEAVQLLDHMIRKIEDDAYKAAEAISYMGQQAFEYQAQDKINNKGIHDILAHHDGKSKYFDSEGKEHTTTKFTESDIQGILNGDSAAWDKLMGMEKEFTKDELDSLQEMINSKVEATEKLMETQKQVYEQIGVVFDEATDKMERQMNRIEHLQNITDSYANITDLVGRKKLGMTNEMLNELDLAKVDQSLSKLRGAKELMDTQKNMMSTLQNQFVQNADGTWSNNLKATYKDANGKEISRQDYWKQQADALRKQGITNQASKADIKTDKTTLKGLKDDKKAQDAEYKQQLKDLQAQKKALDSELSKATKAEEAAAKKSKATSVSGLNKLNYFGSGGILKALQGSNLDIAAILSGKKTGGGGRTHDETTTKLSRSSKDIQKELKAVEDQIKKTEDAQKKYDETQQKSIDAAQAKVNKDQQEATLMQEKLDLYDKLANSDSVQLTERDVGLLTDQMEHMEDAIQDSTENFYSSWEEAIKKISELYTNMIGRAIEDASDKLAGKLGSLDELADRFAKSQELDERYVADYEKIYEFSKLNRDIINSIDETDNVKAKQALAEYQKEINQLEEDETEISKYQIENARRRYELLLAQLALEEARDAKSQVQMTRSSTGEWSYVYTADESQVAEAEQNYEDKLFAMQQANAEYINELQQNIVDLQQRMMEEIQQLRVEDYASYEEYMEAVNNIKEHYGVLMDYNMEQLGIVFDEQTRLYDEDWAKYSEATGYKISTDENYLNKWNETALAKQTGFDTMQEMHETFNKTSEELLEKSSEAYQTWSGLIDTAMVDAGTSTDDFATKLNTDVGQMNADAAEAAAAMEALGDAAEDAFSRMTEALSNWQAEYSAAIEDMLEKNEALAKSFNELLKAWSGYNDTVGQDSGDEGGGDEDTPTGGEDPTGGGDTPTGGGGKGSGYAVIDKGYRYYIYEEDGSNTGKSDVHWGFGSKSKDRTYNLSRKIHAGGKDLYELADHPGKFLSGPSASHKHIYWNEGGRRTTHTYTTIRESRRRRRRSSSYRRRSRPSSRGSDLRDRGYPSSTDGYRPRTGGGCFEAGTQILMADLTTKNIEDININDMVMAYNEELMTYEPCAVIESYTHHNTPALMEVYLNDGSVIKMTPAHPILTVEGWKSRDVNMSLWEHRMSVDYLTLEDTIIGHNGFYSIVEIREYALPENYDTYNLAVDKCHTFIADNIVVHNTVSKYASGGYTGDWGTSDGRIAILHEKEIVLNKEDTANFLTGIGILRDITNAIDLNALASAGYLANLGSAGTVSTGTLEQEVHITAEFPNATDKESIKEAFNDLINLASQYAGRM